MSRAVVGRWGKSLAVRIPSEIARASGLTDGEEVEVEAVDGTLVIRRPAALASARRRAEVAAAAIIGDRRRYPIGDLTIRELIDEGRR